MAVSNSAEKNAADCSNYANVTFTKIKNNLNICTFSMDVQWTNFGSKFG